MKKSMKVVVIALAVVLVLSVMSTALADSYTWAGSANYGFDTSGMNRRISDQTAEAVFSDVSKGGYGKGGGTQNWVFQFLPRDKSYRKNMYDGQGFRSGQRWAPTYMILDCQDLWGYELNGYISGRVDNPMSSKLYSKGTHYLY